MLNGLRKTLRRFARDTGGQASIELAIFTPLLLSLLAAGYVYFDAFRQKAVNINAAYTISDALSRETDEINPNYLDGLHEMLEFLTHSTDQVGLRVTMVHWNEPNAEYRIDWSKTRGPLYPLKDRDVNSALADNLPTLLHNERVIVVETSTTYNPIFKVPGLSEQEMYNFAFTRPRFAPKLVWADY
ncbi:MAG: pilus assembly protein [Rhodobacteraceae bacterium]|nr:MAG: pilus assembly protein [Paracoccaceae bacterium]